MIFDPITEKVFALALVPLLFELASTSPWALLVVAFLALLS